MSELTAKGVPPTASLLRRPSPARAQEKCALEQVYDQYWGELCGYVNKAFGAGPPDPEDVAQTAFMKYASLKNPEKIRNPRAFLYTAARNTVLDHKRRQRTQEAHATAYLQIAQQEADQISPERVLVEKERLSIIKVAIAQLPQKQRHVFLLSTLEGCGYAEISRRTGVPKSSVRRYVTKAMAACEAALTAAAKDGPGEDG